MLHVRLTDEVLDDLMSETEKMGIGASTLARMLLMKWLKERRNGPQEPERQP